MACPNDNALLEYAEGLLDDASRIEIEGHLDGCARCLASVCHAITDDENAFGRYLIVDVLGRGSMGVVYRALDPELDRAVALKVLAPDVTEGLDQARRDLLAREARMLARLAHPNIVVVYDAGLSGRRVFLAMELVEGGDLRAWLQDSRSTREILHVFDGVANGLGAAHEAGVIHRDIKPENIFVDASGRARIGDFGLARLRRSDSTAGAGTPLYMAPEAADDGIADARSDQFSLCVTMFEALRGRRIPRRVRNALRRGSSADPSDRFASMLAFRKALRGGRRRWVAVAVAGAGALVAGGIAWPSQDDELCTGARQAIGETWNDARRTQVRANLTEAGADPGVAPRIEATLDEYTRIWITTHTDACRATAWSREQSEAQLELRMACLAGARRQLQATLTVLSHANPDVVGSADRLVSYLPPLRDCSDPDLLGPGGAPVPDAVRKPLDEVLSKVAAARAWFSAGSADAANMEIDAARELANEMEYEPAMTFVIRMDGELAMYRGDFASAERHYLDALERATRHDQQNEVAAVSSQLVQVMAAQARPDEGLVYAAFAMAAAPNDLARADVEGSIGKLQLSRGDLVAAEAALLRALAIEATGMHWMNREAIRSDLLQVYRLSDRLDEGEALAREIVEAYQSRLDEDHVDVAMARARLAAILYKRGRYAESTELFHVALPRLSDQWGDAHPTVAGVRSVYANALAAQGRLDLAEAEHRASHSALAGRLGADHPSTLAARANVAKATAATGNVDDAVREYRLVVDGLIAHFGAEDPRVGSARTGLAMQLSSQGRFDDARREFLEALRIHHARLGTNHAKTAFTEYNFGRSLAREGKFEEAERHHRVAVAVESSSVATDSLALYRVGLADVLIERCRLEEAETELEIARSIYRGIEARPGDRERLALTSEKLLTRSCAPTGSTDRERPGGPRRSALPSVGR